MKIYFNSYFALDNNKKPLRVTATCHVEVAGRQQKIYFTGATEADAESGLMRILEEMEVNYEWKS